MRTVKERLEANRRLLSVLQPGSEEFNVATARQQAVFDASMTAMPRIPEMQAVELCEEVANVGWPSYAAQVAAVMEHVFDPAEIRFNQPTTSRTAQQNFTSIEHHMPERIWNGSKEDFLRSMCEFCCVDLGLVYASEPTVQKLVALAILVTEGRNGHFVVRWQEKRRLIDVAKRSLKSYRYQKPVEWISVLPIGQIAFQAIYPTQWQLSTARGDNRAVPCPCIQTDINVVLDTVQCGTP